MIESLQILIISLILIMSFFFLMILYEYLILMFWGSLLFTAIFSSLFSLSSFLSLIDYSCTVQLIIHIISISQCLKCLVPVNIIAMPRLLHSAITSSSFFDPPGWIIYLIPPKQQASTLSLNGRKASDARTTFF